jgi:hypothetical protein
LKFTLVRSYCAFCSLRLWLKEHEGGHLRCPPLHLLLGSIALLTVTFVVNFLSTFYHLFYHLYRLSISLAYHCLFRIFHLSIACHLISSREIISLHFGQRTHLLAGTGR